MGGYLTVGQVVANGLKSSLLAGAGCPPAGTPKTLSLQGVDLMAGYAAILPTA